MALTFISIDSSDGTASTVNTDGPAFYKLQDKQIGGETVEVKAFAEGQAGIYQVIDGTLQVFDPVDGTYTVLGSEATVTVNAIGFNVQDSLIYGIAVGNGFDSLGKSVSKTDLVMLDAAGNSYKIGATPYRSRTGDFDASGNLWAFQSSLDWITMIDVDNVDANGDVATKTFKFPKEMITDHLWDVAFDAASQCFSGVTRPSAEGENATMYIINVSGVADGGMPTFETLDVVGTMIDGVMHAGVPAVTFGGAIHDADGNFYVAGNSGDHDMNDTLNGGSDKDKLYGGTGHDVIHGDQGSDYINAGQGDDTVYAGEGRDKILSGAGSDEIWGGADTDWFVFRSSDATNSIDTVHDYTHDGVENDRLDLRSFDVLSDGGSSADWIADHITQNADNSVTLGLDGMSIILIDHANLQDQFYDQVLDGLQL